MSFGVTKSCIFENRFLALFKLNFKTVRLYSMNKLQREKENDSQNIASFSNRIYKWLFGVVMCKVDY